MKRVFILIFLSAFVSFSKSQNLVWIKDVQLNTPHQGILTSYISGIETDSQGYLYAAGGYEIQSNGYFYGTFINKIDKSGNEMWRDTSEELSPVCHSFVKDQNYFYSGGNNFIRKHDSNGNLILDKYSGADDMVYYNGFLYVVTNNQFKRYDISGGLIWTKQINQYGNLLIEKGEAGYLYIQAGDGNSYNPGFVNKYDTLGHLIWSKSLPSCCYTFSADENGNCYITGHYGGSVSFGNITVNCKKCNYWYDRFIARLNSDGTWAWARNIEYDEITSAIPSLQNGYLFTGELNELNGSTVIGYYDKATGNYIKNVTVPPADNFYEIASIVQNGNTIYLGGHKAGQTPQAFLARIDDSTLETGVSEATKNDFSFAVYPNPTSGGININYTATGTGTLQLNIIDAKGKLVYTETIYQSNGEFKKDIDLGRQAKGLYFVELISAGKKKVVKRVVLD